MILHINVLCASATVFDGMIALDIMEATAIGEALSLAFDLYAAWVWVISDCLGMIKNLNSGNTLTRYGFILK